MYAVSRAAYSAVEHDTCSMESNEKRGDGTMRQNGWDGAG